MAGGAGRARGARNPALGFPALIRAYTAGGRNLHEFPSFPLFCFSVYPLGQKFMHELEQDKLAQASATPTLCLTGLSWNAYSCSVKELQRWQRNEHSHWEFRCLTSAWPVPKACDFVRQRPQAGVVSDAGFWARRTELTHAKGAMPKKLVSVIAGRLAWTAGRDFGPKRLPGC